MISRRERESALLIATRNERWDLLYACLSQTIAPDEHHVSQVPVDELNLVLFLTVKNFDSSQKDRLYEIIHKLILSGAQTDACTDGDWNSTKHVAIQNNDPILLAILLKYNKNMPRNRADETPHDMADRLNRRFAAKYCTFIEQGIEHPLTDIRSKDELERTLAEEMHNTTQQEPISANFFIEFLCSSGAQTLGLLFLIIGGATSLGGIIGLLAGIKVILGSSSINLIFGGAAYAAVGAVLKYGSRFFENPTPPTPIETAYYNNNHNLLDVERPIFTLPQRQ